MLIFLLRITLLGPNYALEEPYFDLYENYEVSAHIID